MKINIQIRVGIPGYIIYLFLTINPMSNENSNRVSVTALDDLIGKQFKVLDDGFIRVVDYMGGDEAIVQAARVSYGKGTKKLSEDKGLIRYLMRHSHSTPFEMCEIKLHVRVPMDCWRQWIRHRTANVNEYSTRYSLAIDSAQRTTLEEWRIQSTANKQGSGEFIDDRIGRQLSEREEALQTFSREVYQERIDSNVAREQARKDLPLSTYTEAYWKIDLHNLFHFLSLRMDSHAQYEIRSYANVIGNEIVKKWCPLAWEAFENYRLNSFNLTEIEIFVIKNLISGNLNEVMSFLTNLKLLTYENGGIKKSREFSEIEDKLKKLNIVVDWSQIQNQ
jgi:thymidylate synthase (FAD)